MLKFIKVTNLEEMKTLKNFKSPMQCSKCGCTDESILYIINNTMPQCEDTSKYSDKLKKITVCYCSNCCPFDILTYYENTYSTEDEYKLFNTYMAFLMREKGLNKKDISETILGFDINNL